MVTEAELQSVVETVTPEVWDYLCECEDNCSIAIEADNYVGICTKNGQKITISISDEDFAKVKNRYKKGIEQRIAKEVYENMPLEDSVCFKTVVKGKDFHTIVYTDDEGELMTMTWPTLPIKIHHCIPSYFKA